MTIEELFSREPWAARLSRRRINFLMMTEHAARFAEKHGLCQIIETGSAWDKNNWEYQGQSTLIWDWLIENFSKSDARIKVTSIDITPASTEAAKAQTKNVDFITADSVLTLSCATPDDLKDCGLLYLDSYDWTEQKNVESAFHHMAELCACYRLLPSGCLIVVDDRHGDEKGKHWLVEAFMSHYLKLAPVFKNHQIGFVKP